MKSLVKYFAGRPLVTNLVLFGVILGAIGLWDNIGKEEYPDVTMPFLRCSIPYPGAAAEDVELFVIKPIEEKLKGITGLYEVNATASYGGASLTVILENNLSNPDEVVMEIKDAVDRAELPDETEDPVYRRFSTANKAIIDIGFFNKNKPMLDTEGRAQLQSFALAFKNRMLALPEISGIDERSYLQPELQILIDAAKLRKYDISLSEIRNQIMSQNIRMPAGSMEDHGESEVSFLSELDNVKALEKVIVRGGFEGQKIRLKEVGKVRNGFERNKTVMKVNGHEGILFNIRKSASVDILSATEKVVEFVDNFRKSNPDSPIEMVLIDDESYSIRNRLSIIGFNGLVGFLMIIFVLFLFLDARSSIWVAAGLPFILGFTLISALLLGYTVNNVTLAGVIIVLGIVVDDAIIVAENVSRLRRSGIASGEAVVSGTTGVLLPVLASVLTTCAAFIPLLFFEGHFARFVIFIPAVVFIMLGASLIESFFILPGHLHHSIPRPGIIQRIWKSTSSVEKNGHWFFLLERKYASFLKRALKYRVPIIGVFIIILISSFYIYDKKMKFVMFPREESKEITISVKAKEGTTRLEMAKLTEPVENILLEDENKYVMSVLTLIAQSRRGGEVKENEAILRAEMIPPSERKMPLKKLIAKWEEKASSIDGLTEVKFMRSRWGSDSGSPIEFEVQENNDDIRKKVAEKVKEELAKHPQITNVEIERPVTRKEYKLNLKGDDVFMMGINPSDVGRSLRAFIEGQILYKINKGEEEVDVRLTSDVKDKKDIESILSLRTANAQGYLVPYSSLVKMEEAISPANIQRINYKRTTKIFADLKENSKTTPLDIAEFLETNIFPEVSKGYPNTIFQFRGEIEDSKDSQADFVTATLLALGLIYFLLVVLYDSLLLPLLIGAAIPFGTVGVILAFMGHGMDQYGFFAVIGTLGMIGVVINDSVVMISKLQRNPDRFSSKKEIYEKVADISSTRLRAVVVTTLTTVAGLFPTAYGWAGYDSMLSEMMLAMGWGLIFGTLITLLLIPCLYSFYARIWWKEKRS